MRVKVKGRRELITVIGSEASVTAGEYIEVPVVSVSGKV
ncbi:hypothetical protein NMYAN_210004 [Nitrosomonas nitrosa]|uniref:Uncharacterized protein n=1 Tax=Nitrosomonas nitrosa TaxID=52442 RepID=A0A8H8Z0P9_9PROT|nr:hypothetical protein NMYAN_210004 [Nitrosomonas nitrosa]